MIPAIWRRTVLSLVLLAGIFGLAGCMYTGHPDDSESKWDDMHWDKGEWR